MTRYVYTLGIALACWSAMGQLETFSFGKKEKVTSAYEDTVAVEVPLTAEEYEEALIKAQKESPLKAGESRLIQVKKTKWVKKPKAEVYAPPTETAQDAKQLTHYFCALWKKGEFEKMYYAMDTGFRKRVSYADFAQRFQDDANATGGLNDERIREEVQPTAQGVRLTVTLHFQWPRVNARTVKADLMRTREGFRFSDSGLIPASY